MKKQELGCAQDCVAGGAMGGCAESRELARVGSPGGAARVEGNLKSAAGVKKEKKIWREPVIESWEEVLARVPRPREDGRYVMAGSCEILAQYWRMFLLTNRWPTRKEFEKEMPRWKAFFRSFRDLERTAGVTWEKTAKGWRRRQRKTDPPRGLPLLGRAMATEPVNEQGVVVLFGEMAKELGFVIDRIGTRFPDCVAKRKVGEEWEFVRIEFEFLSSRFDHDPAGCDLVVCWKDDWPGCPVQVLALEEKVKGRWGGPK